MLNAARGILLIQASLWQVHNFRFVALAGFVGSSSPHSEPVLHRLSSMSSNTGTDATNTHPPPQARPSPPRKLTLPSFDEYVDNLLRKSNLTVEFPQEVEHAARKAIEGDSRYVAPDAAAQLADFADRPYITIDNDDSTDLDQAMYIAPWDGPPPRRGRSNGNNSGEEGGIRKEKSKRTPDHYLVSYALADGRHYLPPASPLFETALLRGGATYYLPTLSVPMLPRCLSEDAMSLNPNVLRRALVFEMLVDAESGEVQHAKPVWAKVKSVWKGSYRLVQEYYDEADRDSKSTTSGNPIFGSEYEETVLLLRTVGQLRRALMRRRNIVELHRSEIGIAYDSKTDSIVKTKTKRYESELFNEQISLMCNMEGARLLEALDVVEDLVGERDDVTPIYRYQDAPRKDQIDTLVSLIDSLIVLHSLDPFVFQWKPRGGLEGSVGGEYLGDYLKRLHRRLDSGKTDAVAEIDVVRAIDKQAVVTNVGAHFGGEARPHHSLRVDAYARFSSPMRELVGCFTHKQLWDGIYAQRLGIDTSKDDPNLRDKIIKAASKAKTTQKRLGGASFLYLMDRFFAPDLEIPEGRRPRRRGVILGIDSNAERKKRKHSRKVYVKIDELEVKVSLADIESIYGVRYHPTDTIGQYGVCVEVKPKETVRGAPTFYVGQSVDLSVFDHVGDKYWMFKIAPARA